MYLVIKCCNSLCATRVISGVSDFNHFFPCVKALFVRACLLLLAHPLLFGLGRNIWYKNSSCWLSFRKFNNNKEDKKIEPSAKLIISDTLPLKILPFTPFVWSKATLTRNCIEGAGAGLLSYKQWDVFHTLLGIRVVLLNTEGTNKHFWRQCSNKGRSKLRKKN